MKITEVSLEDGRHCAAVINALNIAKFDGLTGKDIEVLMAAKRWLASIATQMAGDLKSKQAPAAAPASESFRVKSVGKLPPVKPAKRKK